MTSENPLTGTRERNLSISGSLLERFQVESVVGLELIRFGLGRCAFGGVVFHARFPVTEAAAAMQRAAPLKVAKLSRHDGAA